jgi:hypothetical protein
MLERGLVLHGRGGLGFPSPSSPSQTVGNAAKFWDASFLLPPLPAAGWKRSLEKPSSSSPHPLKLQVKFHPAASGSDRRSLNLNFKGANGADAMLSTTLPMADQHNDSSVEFREEYSAALVRPVYVETVGIISRVFSVPLFFSTTSKERWLRWRKKRYALATS